MTTASLEDRVANLERMVVTRATISQVAELEARSHRRHAAVLEEFGLVRADIASLREGMDGIDARLDGIDTRLGGMDARFDGIDTRLDGMDARFDGIDTRLDGMDARFDGIDTRLDRMDTRLDAQDALLGTHTVLLNEILDRLPPRA